MNISVIIPVLNEENIIRECLDQFQKFKSEVYEIIVCDGGSTDKTLDILKERVDCRLCKSSPGRGNQMNVGAQCATGDVFLFLHADSFLACNAFQLMCQRLADQTIIGGFFVNEMYGQEKRSILFRSLAKLLTVRSRVTMRPYGDMGIFVRREHFLKLHGYRDIPIMEDYEFSKRLKKMGQLARIRSPLRTSVRRFRGRLVRTVFLMQMMKILFNCGVSPQFLQRWYTNIR